MASTALLRVLPANVNVSSPISEFLDHRHRHVQFTTALEVVDSAQRSTSSRTTLDPLMALSHNDANGGNATYDISDDLLDVSACRIGADWAAFATEWPSSQEQNVVGRTGDS